MSHVTEEEDTEASGEVEDTPSITMTATSTAFSLIETSHSVFGRVKRLWNSPMESHREVGVAYSPFFPLL